MGSFYSGSGWNKTFLGHCEEGIIYSGSGNMNPIGRYNGESVYNQFKEYAGSYGGGSIYDANNKHVGNYENGVVYDTYLKPWNQQVGSYDSNPAEAAALVLLFLGGNRINTRNNPTEEDTTADAGATTYSSSNGDSETSCLTVIFDIILVTLGFIFKLLRIFFLAYLLPRWASITLYGLILMLLTEFIPAVFPVAITVILLLFYLFFPPFWVALLWQKFKKRLLWKEVCSFYWKWFIKGPFAYPELAKMLEEKQSMPKVVKAINSISNWLKKIFKKKPKN